MKRANSRKSAAPSAKRRRVAKTPSDETGQLTFPGDPAPSEQLMDVISLDVWKWIVEYVEGDPASAMAMARSCKFFRELFQARIDHDPTPTVEEAIRIQVELIVHHIKIRVYVGSWAPWQVWQLGKNGDSNWSGKAVDNLWSRISLCVYTTHSRLNNSEIPFDSVPTDEHVSELVSHIKAVVREYHEPWMFAIWSRVMLFLRSSASVMIRSGGPVSCFSCGKDMLIDPQRPRYTPRGLLLKGMRGCPTDQVPGEVAIEGTVYTMSVRACRNCVEPVPYRKHEYGDTPDMPAREKTWFKPLKARRGGDPTNDYCVSEARYLKCDMLDNSAWAHGTVTAQLVKHMAEFAAALKCLLSTMRELGLRLESVEIVKKSFVEIVLRMTKGIPTPVSHHDKWLKIADLITRVTEYENELRELATLVKEKRMTDYDLFFLGYDRFGVPWETMCVKAWKSASKRIKHYKQRKRPVENAQSDPVFALNMVFSVMMQSNGWNKTALKTAIEILMKNGLGHEYMDKLFPPAVAMDVVESD